MLFVLLSISPQADPVWHATRLHAIALDARLDEGSGVEALQLNPSSPADGYDAVGVMDAVQTSS